jgi:hypothetical protein
MVELRTIVIVVALLVIAGGIYYYLQPGGGPQITPSKNGTAILLAAASNAAKVTTYVLVSGTSIDGTEPIISSTVAKGQSARVDINDSIGVLRSFYFLQSGEFVCLPERRTCLLVEKNTTSSKLRNMLGYAGGQIVNVNETAVSGWVSKKAIEVLPGVEEKQIAGRHCEEITYLVHLDLLSSAELEAGGYDPSVAPFVRREVSECLDVSAGFALHKKLNETLLGESHVLELNVSKFDPGAAVEESVFALTGELVSEQTYLTRDAEEIDRKSCMALPLEINRTECFKQRAVEMDDVTYCDFVESDRGRDQCYLLLLPNWKDAKGCERLTILKDDCYYELALRLENSTLCGQVAGAGRRELCGAVLKGNATACIPLVFADECTMMLAARLHDNTICNQIGNETMRTDCLGR